MEENKFKIGDKVKVWDQQATKTTKVAKYFVADLGPSYEYRYCISGRNVDTFTDLSGIICFYKNCELFEEIPTIEIDGQKLVLNEENVRKLKDALGE